jgi:hypothetical protein
MESPLEFHSQKPDTGVEDLCGFGCADQNPGNGYSRDRGLLFHELIIRNPLPYVKLDCRNGVTYTVLMPKKKLPPEVRDYFVKMGRKGGLLGGATRAANMTDEQRSESARKAVLARWQKAKESRNNSR